MRVYIGAALVFDVTLVSIEHPKPNHHDHLTR